MDSQPSLLYEPAPHPPERERLWLHIGLFVATFASMVWSGGAMAGRNASWPRLPVTATTWEKVVASIALLANPTFLHDGLWYAVPFLAFLTVHEFGHYLTARRHGISVSLPYYIPVPAGFGTFGAVIRIREPIRRMTQLFDIGAAGPLAGFVVALAVYTAGVLTLPGADYFAAIGGHEASQAALTATGALPPFDAAATVASGEMAYLFGDTALTLAIAGLGAYRVPAHELMHFPLLLAGWLGLFFTALNLLPVGQLDGGHVVYALFGPRVHRVVARVTVLVLTVSASLGALGAGSFLGLSGWAAWAALVLAAALVAAKLFEGEWRLVVPTAAVVVGLVALVSTVAPGLAARVGFVGWWFWVGLLLFVVRVDHPPVVVRDTLTPARRALGYLCLVIFALTFSLAPLVVV